MFDSTQPTRASGALPHSRLLTHVTLAGALVLGSAQSTAAEFCVGTLAELDAALDQAASASQALFTTTIYLKQGTYNVGATRMTDSSRNKFHALQLLGGYNADCTARVLNPDNTIFDAAGATTFGFQPLAPLLLEGIRFQNVGGNFRMVTVVAAEGAEDVTADIRNNAFNALAAWVVGSENNFALNFLNNRINAYPGSGSGTVPAFRVAAASRVRFASNTLASNLGAGGATFCGNDSVWILNNVAWNNSGDDFRVFDGCDEQDIGDARLRENLYQSATVNPIGDSGNNLVGTDPLFVNAATGDFRLQNASPAVNTDVVSSTTTALDLAGNPRVVGSTVDRGAYESALNDTIAPVLSVTNTADSGAGSLRQALLDANTNPDFSFIHFNIPGPCPQIIAPSSNLPSITQGLLIDAFTQPGSSTNTRVAGDNATRCVVLEGSNARSVGLNYTGASNTQFWLQGMAFSGFKTVAGNAAALRVGGGSNNIIRGNQFGGRLSSAAGSLLMNESNDNIVLTATSRSTVGGDLLAHRNTIADATGNGILISSLTIGMLTNSSNDNEIANNLIGAYGGGEIAAGNNVGIKILTRGNDVHDNAILSNNLDGILMDVADAHSNVIQFNRIGLRNQICLGGCSQAAGNGRHGINLFFGPHDNVIQKNTIRHNGSAGIAIGSSAGGTSLRNALIGNTLYENGAQGMSFNVYNGADNDADPAQQNMANRGMNYPVLSRAYGGTQSGVIEGTLNSVNGNYSIDIYSSAQPDAGFPRGEAEKFHRGFYYVTINNAAPGQNGTKSFSIPFTSTGNLVGRVITVTATDTALNTSELSAPAMYELSDAIFASGFEN